MPKSTRPKIVPRIFRITSQSVIDAIMRLLPNVPIDPDRPLELVLREEVKARTLDQNSLMWVGPLADLAQQGFVRGEQFSADAWHEMFKREFLPEEDDEELPLLVKDPQTYRKWAYTPRGDRFCIGSTTDLSKAGFSRYLEQIHAFGANLGVQFHTNPRIAA